MAALAADFLLELSWTLRFVCESNGMQSNAPFIFLVKALKIFLFSGVWLSPLVGVRELANQAAASAAHLGKCEFNLAAGVASSGRLRWQPTCSRLESLAFSKKSPKSRN